MTDKQTIYSSKEIATLLGIKESTLRKYSIMLQDQGYEFYKNERGHRSFFDKDLLALRRFISLKKKTDMSLKQCSEAVLLGLNSDNVQPSDITTTENETLYDTVMSKLGEQEKFNKELLKRLDQRDEYIEKRLNERDEKLMTAIRGIQEQKQLTVAADPEENKKGFFARLFGG